MVRVLAVIPTLGRDVDRLNAAIDSVRSLTSDPFEILVVNNSGNPEIAGLAEVDSVASPGLNLGYVGALEHARRSRDCDFLWVVQDDMTLENDVLHLLLAEMAASPRLAVASPVTVRDGVVPAGSRAGIFANPERTRWHYVPPHDTRPEDLRTDEGFSFVSGSGALFRTAALAEAGGFNLDLYPLVHVDVEMCGRLLAHGWDIALVPAARIDHRVQGSTPGLLLRTLDELNRPIVERQLETGVREPARGGDSVDADIVQSVARRASYLFLEVAGRGSTRIGELESELAALTSRLAAVESQLESVTGSTSWRVSAPARRIAEAVRRRIARVRG